jgi:hypothetical protein
MDHPMRVRMTNGVAHLAEDLHALRCRELMVIAVAIDRHALDVLHDEVRKPVGRRPAIEQARDVRMIEVGENLALVAEATQYRLSIHPALDDFDRDGLLVLGVGANREVCSAHPAPAQFANEAIGSDVLADPARLEAGERLDGGGRAGNQHRRRFEHDGRSRDREQERFHFAAQRPIATA